MERFVSGDDALLRRAQVCMHAHAYPDAIYCLRRYLAQPDCVWADARCEAMLALAHCHLQMHSRAEAERWILRACGEAPELPLPWQEAAAFYEPVSAQGAALCLARAARLR